MHIDVLHSGQVYSAVLRFSQPVYLTDLSLSTNSNMGCVSVDVWGEEGERGAVRVAQCTEIQEKNLMLGNLTPPPLCQFVKVGKGWWYVEGGGWYVEGGMWSVEGGMWKVEGGMWRVEGGMWSVEGGMWCVEGGWWHVESGGWYVEGGG